eukprot:scaffold5420_cov77-Cylindrotheca_fusiformis.AAC.2
MEKKHIVRNHLLNRILQNCGINASCSHYDRIIINSERFKRPEWKRSVLSESMYRIESLRIVVSSIRQSKDSEQNSGENSRLMVSLINSNFVENDQKEAHFQKP